MGFSGAFRGVLLKVDEIRAWEKDPVTIDFFERLKVHHEDADMEVHKSLAAYDLNNAALHNAGMVMLEEVLDIVYRMIEDAREGGE